MHVELVAISQLPIGPGLKQGLRGPAAQALLGGGELQIGLQQVAGHAAPLHMAGSDINGPPSHRALQHEGESQYAQREGESLAKHGLIVTLAAAAR